MDEIEKQIFKTIYIYIYIYIYSNQKFEEQISYNQQII